MMTIAALATALKLLVFLYTASCDPVLLLDWSSAIPKSLSVPSYRVEYRLSSDEKSFNATTNSKKLLIAGVQPETPYEVYVYATLPSKREILIMNTTIRSIDVPYEVAASNGFLQKYPASEGSVEAKNLQTKISKPALNFVTEGKMLRVSWEPIITANKSTCHRYRVSYTIFTLKVPKNFTMVVTDQYYALIKQYRAHALHVRVSCSQDDDNDARNSSTEIDTVDGQAHYLVGVADFKVPMSVKNFHVAALETGEFYKSWALLSWDWPIYHDFNQYSVILSYFPGKANKQRKDIDIDHQLQFFNISDLNPTDSYTFLIRNVSKFNIPSKISAIQQIMPPIISSMIYPGKITSTTIDVSFSPTDGDQTKFDSYRFVFQFDTEQNFTQVRNKSDTRRSFSFENLQPGTTYRAFLYTVFQTVQSRPVMASLTTYPLKPKSMRSIVRRNAVRLFWELEDSARLSNVTFKVQYTGSDGSESAAVLTKQQSHTFTLLKPEIWFTLGVTIVVDDQESDVEASTVVTGFEEIKEPALISATSYSLSINFTRDFFTESNGKIVSYAIIVTENNKLDTFDLPLLSWKDVQNQEMWSPYQATPENFTPFPSYRQDWATFVIGETSCARQKHYCNGPLRPHTNYFVKLRACTDSDACMETDYAKFMTAPGDTFLESRTKGDARNYLIGSAPRLRCLYIGLALLPCLRYLFPRL